MERRLSIDIAASLCCDTDPAGNIYNLLLFVHTGSLLKQAERELLSSDPQNLIWVMPTKGEKCLMQMIFVVACVCMR